jgi:N4-(beta-N-acetylglucosaminyl)-L-asparaginase
MKTQSRRQFIKKSTLTAAAFSLLTNSNKAGQYQQAVVLSTWNFGLKANEEAWRILSQKGAALDAVEAGVKLVEADPNERSVGYGGRPDRDGYVTLDA